MPLKKINIRNTLIIIFCCLLINGCKKNTDYREKFIGNYNFLIHRTDWVMPSTITDTTYNYNGKIEFGTKENTILIIFSEQTPSIYSYEPIIYEDGTFNIIKAAFGSSQGEFESTSKVKFQIGNYQPGYSNEFEITGEKK